VPGFGMQSKVRPHAQGSSVREASSDQSLSRSGFEDRRSEAMHQPERSSFNMQNARPMPKKILNLLFPLPKRRMNDRRYNHEEWRRKRSHQHRS
jgi:hypothetical protein